MQQCISYTRDSEDFLSKFRNFTSIPDGSFLVTVDVLRLYPSIPHSAGFNFLIKFTNRLWELLLVLNYRHPPLYACLYMHEVETELLKTENIKPFLWLRYIDDIFFIGHVEKNN